MRSKKSGGGAVQKQIDKYCTAMRRSTQTFKDGHRAASTASEHDMYVRLVSCWAERSGFGTYAVERKAKDGCTTPLTSCADREGRAHGSDESAQAGDDFLHIQQL